MILAADASSIQKWDIKKKLSLVLGDGIYNFIIYIDEGAVLVKELNRTLIQDDSLVIFQAKSIFGRNILSLS